MVEPMEMLRRGIAREGSQRKGAKALGVSPSYLSFLLNGKTKMSRPMLERLGYRSQVVIKRVAS